jgi:hypothetical protein
VLHLISLRVHCKILLPCWEWSWDISYFIMHCIMSTLAFIFKALGKAFNTQWTEGWVGSRASLEAVENPLPHSGIRHWSLGCPAHIQSLYWLSYPGSSENTIVCIQRDLFSLADSLHGNIYPILNVKNMIFLQYYPIFGSVTWHYSSIFQIHRMATKLPDLNPSDYHVGMKIDSIQYSSINWAQQSRFLLEGRDRVQSLEHF